MNTSRLPPRHNHPCHAPVSAALRRWAGARVCDPQQRWSEPGARPRPTTHSLAADSKSALLAAIALPAALAWAALPLSAAVIDDFSGPKRFRVFAFGGHPEVLADGQLKITLPDANASGGAAWDLTYAMDGCLNGGVGDLGPPTRGLLFNLYLPKSGRARRARFADPKDLEDARWIIRQASGYQCFMLPNYPECP